jgi:nucleoid-associated protein YgaU
VQFDSRIIVAAEAAPVPVNSVEQLDIDWPATVSPAADHKSAQLDVDWPAAGQLHRPTTARAAKTARHAPINLDWPTGDPANESVRGIAPGGAVVVHRGDSLWSIAARHLPADAAAADVARTWHRWYATNATVIGPDPNLILPGQILLPPTHETGE